MIQTLMRMCIVSSILNVQSFLCEAPILPIGERNNAESNWQDRSMIQTLMRMCIVSSILNGQSFLCEAPILPIGERNNAESNWQDRSNSNEDAWHSSSSNSNYNRSHWQGRSGTNQNTNFQYRKPNSPISKNHQREHSYEIHSRGNSITKPTRSNSQFGQSSTPPATGSQNSRKRNHNDEKNINSNSKSRSKSKKKTAIDETAYDDEYYDDFDSRIDGMCDQLAAEARKANK